jgi:hypothetical protein
MLHSVRPQSSFLLLLNLPSNSLPLYGKHLVAYATVEIFLECGLSVAVNPIQRVGKSRLEKFASFFVTLLPEVKESKNIKERRRSREDGRACGCEKKGHRRR